MLKRTLLSLALLLAACSSSPSGSSSKPGHHPDADGGAPSEAGAAGEPASGAGGESGGGEAGGPEAGAPDGGMAGASAPGTPLPMVTIISPAGGAQVTGLVKVVIQVDAPGKLSTMSFGPVGQLQLLKQPTTELLLDTSKLPEGDATVRVEANDELGQTGSAELKLKVKLPAARVLSYRQLHPHYANGDVIDVTVTASKAGLTLAPDFSVIDSAFDQTRVTVTDLGAGVYHVTYPLSTLNARKDLRYHVPVTLSLGADSATANLDVTLQNTPTFPFQIDGAVFAPGAPPVASGTALAPTVTVASGSQKIINGGSATLGLAVSPGMVGPATRILVSVTGFSGYFVVPTANLVAPVDTQGTLNLKLTLPTTHATQANGFLYHVQVTVADAYGNVSNWVEHQLGLVRVGSGDVQISLAWDTPTDVDLHVFDPSNAQIYYGAKTSASGGKLDLDSNPACAIDNVNNENVVWPAGKAPNGTYKVNVALYEACGNQGANYTVTVTSCGKTNQYSGSLTPAQASTSSAGIQVATLDRNCGYHVHGQALYEKVDTVTGTSSMEPISLAQIVVRRASDDQVLVDGDTDSDGNYDLSFFNNGAAGYYVEVRANHRLNGVDQVTVYPTGTDAAHAVKTSPQSEVTTPDLEADITVSEPQSSGAFNVLDDTRRGLDYALIKAGKSLPQLKVYWARGQAAPNGGSYATPAGDLYIGGAPDDPDEFDDSVVLHEFFHFVMRNLSDANPVGGPHQGLFENPSLAWNEGVATFFGQVVKGDSVYWDSASFGGTSVDIESNTLPDTHGTATSAIDGDVSEHLVSMVLWDLYDPANEPHDLFDSEEAGILDSVFGYFPSASFADRGATGKDLVDFLDGWRCKGHGRDDDMKTLLDERAFPYDFATLAACP